MTAEKSQTNRFKEAARALECDDLERFSERVKSRVKPKPVEKPE